MKIRHSKVALETRGRFYEARIAYPADKSWKHNRLIQAFHNRTLILYKY